MIKSMLLAGCGGFVGTCSRYLVNRLCAALWATSFPVATFAANITGCLLFGLFTGLAERQSLLSPAGAVLLITGFCGGFTTYSAFAGEIYDLSDRGRTLTAVIYLCASLIIGIAAVALGRRIAA